MLQFFGVEKGLTLSVPKSATIFWAVNGEPYPSQKMLQFVGLERVNHFQLPKIVVYEEQN
jgi:hypothetical protein